MVRNQEITKRSIFVVLQVPAIGEQNIFGGATVAGGSGFIVYPGFRKLHPGLLLFDPYRIEQGKIERISI